MHYPYPNMWNFPGGAAEPMNNRSKQQFVRLQRSSKPSLDPSNYTEIWRYSHEHAAIVAPFVLRHLLTRHPSCMKVPAWAWMTLTEIPGFELGFEQAKIVGSC